MLLKLNEYTNKKLLNFTRKYKFLFAIKMLRSLNNRNSFRVNVNQIRSMNKT